LGALATASDSIVYGITLVLVIIVICMCILAQTHPFGAVLWSIGCV